MTKKSLFLIITVIIINISASWAKTIYVNTSAAGNNTGNSWANAFTSLQTALDNAVSGDVIWVAAGTYKPSAVPDIGNGSAIRDYAFLLKAGVQIYGGFEGWETYLSQRNWRTNICTLSGDLDNSGTVSNGDAYHVVISVGDSTAAGTLDGFTITGGNANGDVTAITVNNRNVSRWDGGGVSILFSSPTLRNLIISGNSAEYGGGVSNDINASPILVNVLISGNRALGNGGGMSSYSSSPTLTNVTIAGNTAGLGGGMYHYFSLPLFRNTIVLGNIDSAGGVIGVPSPTFYNCLIQDRDDTNNNCINSSGVTPNMIFVNPLSPGLSNGGDYHLMSGNNIVLDKGNDTYNTETTDLDGNPRKIGTIDLGAFESSAPITRIHVDASKTTGGNNGLTWTDAFISLQSALNMADAGDTIWVAAGTYKPSKIVGTGTALTNRDKAFLLIKDVKIYGGFPNTGNPTMANRNWNTNLSILSGDIDNENDSTDNAYHVLISADAVGAACLDGFTITGGNANGNGYVTINGNTVYRANGGGMSNRVSSPTLVNLTINKNNADLGGGIYNYTSSPTMTNIVISENSSTNSGGGMHNASSSSPAITNVVVAGNKANIGGGISNSFSSLTLTNVAITGNMATAEGGGMHNTSSSPRLINVTMAGNAANDGSGIYNVSSSPQIQNTIIFGNSGLDGVIGTGTPSYNYCLIQGRTNISNGCISAANITSTDVFVNPLSSGLSIGGNYALTTGSPAINTGNITYNSTSTDLNGNARKIGSNIDMGAYEHTTVLWKVTFNSQGGSAIPQYINVLGIVQAPTPEPMRTGYIFVDWYREANCTNKWNFNTNTITQDTTLYAKWDTIKYAVTFNSNGGSTVVPINNVPHGTTITAPTAPTRAGYTFDGWYREAALTNVWNFNTDIVTSATTLYAKWDTIKYTITFNSNGGNTITAYNNILYGQTISKPTDPTRTGYIFNSWCKDIALTNVWNFSTDTVTSNMTLYAKWDTIKYAVTFISNGGIVTTYDSVPYGTTISKPTDPTRAGYIFNSWHRNTSLTNAWNFNPDVVTSGMTLYAKWDTNKFTVTFNSNNGSTVTAYNNVPYETTISKPNNPTRTGYIFNRWCKDISLENAWDFNTDVVISAMTLYAKWDTIKYTVTFNSNGGNVVTAYDSIPYGTNISKPANPIRTGYIFNSWHRNITLTNVWDFNTNVVTSAMTLYAKWDTIKYAVTFISNGDIVTTYDSVPYRTTMSKPTDPTRTGYTFNSWHKNATLTNAWNFNTDVIISDTTLYAKWDTIKYTISFNSNGGSTVTAYNNIPYGTIISQPADPTRTGYIFHSWHKNIALTNVWDFNTNVVTSAMTLYAKWDTIKYPVAFNSNGGSAVATYDSVPYGTTISKPIDPTRTGYIFNSWHRNATLTNVWNFNTNTVTSGMMLYAKWDTTKYTVIFNSFEGSAVAAYGSVPYKTTIISPTVPEMTGHTFGGWYKDTSFSNIWDFTSDEITQDTMLYAKWDIITGIVIIFESNGGTGVNPAQATYGDKISAPNPEPTKTGYTFINWYKDATFNEIWNFATDSITQDTVLYAKWIINNYTVTFICNGGDTVLPVQIVYNTNITNFLEPTKIGHTFGGWYKDLSCTIAWDSTIDVVTFDMNLYAKWDAIIYTITFESNDGDTVSPIQAAFGTTITTPYPEPAKTGYTFVNWYKDADFNTIWDFDIDVITQDTTIYAKWNINNYTVTFLCNDGDTVLPVQAIYKTTITTPIPEPTRTGYTFVDWYKDTAFNDTWDFDTDTVTQDTMLYAKWNINNYTVTFICNDGDTILPVQVIYKTKVETPIIPIKTGYTFIDWYKDTAFSDAWDFDMDVITQDTTLYAKWEINNYTVTFFCNDGDTVLPMQAVYKTKILIPTPEPAKTGHTFVDWYRDANFSNIWDFDADTITQDTIIYAKWNINTYTVTFHCNDGDTVLSVQTVYNTNITMPTTPIKVGYTFVNWYRDADFSNVWNFNTYTITQDTILYAKWDINNYTVTFQCNGGDTVLPIQAIYKTTIAIPTPEPTRAGYTFINWYRNANFSNVWNFNTDTITQDTILYAKWDINIYTVTFHCNDGDTVFPAQIAYRNKVSVPSPEPTRKGYTFINWYKDANFNNVWDFNTDTVISDITLYAKWDINNYTVTFQCNDGDTVFPVQAVYNTTIANPTEPTKTGHIFVGWYKDANFTDEWDFSIDIVTEDITLYAKWDAIIYTILFESNGGEEVTPIQAAYGTTITEPITPAKEGHIFVDWYKESGFINTWDFASNIITADIILYAKWEAIIYTVSFESNGGTTIASIQAAYETCILEPETPTKEGHVFAIWYKDESLTNAWNFVTDVVTADMTLYAKWDLAIYTVTFESSGGTAVASVNAAYQTTVSEPKEPTMQDYAFRGWYKEPALINRWDFETDIVTTNITLYARWIPSTSISEIKEIKVNVYPNPVQDILYIQSSSEVEQILIYDINGRMLISTVIANNNTVIARSTDEEPGSTTWQPPTHIDVSTLATGIYLVKVRTAQGETVRKIVKQ